MTENLPARLRNFIPADRVLEALEERITYARDGTQRAESVPDVVVRAASADEVEAIVALAHEHQVPITPRGAGTSTTGGAIPVKKGIVLDLTAMNRIKEINARDFIAVVQPGVTIVRADGGAFCAGGATAKTAFNRGCLFWSCW